MRFINALKADIIFQYRQGFYLVYLLITFVYLAIISKLPQGDVKAYGVMLIVFSDPSMIGFFFIGGIVMLEKVQGIIKYLGVTPLNSMEYLASKSVSLSIVSLFAALIITKVNYSGDLNVVILIVGVFLSAIFFTLFGFLVASRARTINQYFIRMVPFLLFLVLPCFSLLIKPNMIVFDIFPSVAGLRIIQGAFFGIPLWQLILDVSLLLFGTVIVGILSKRAFIKILICEEE